MSFDPFIYGKDKTENIVSVDIAKDIVHIFTEKDGRVNVKTAPAVYYALFAQEQEGSVELRGNLHYRFGKKYRTRTEMSQDTRRLEARGGDVFRIYNPVEAYLVKNGITYFKGLTPGDVSVLSFDIETTGITHDKDSKVLLISNTLRSGGKTITKLFKYDDYETNEEMINAWCKWIRKMDPTILVGHNVFGFDLPYLNFCSGRAGLQLGRDGSKARFGRNPRQFRKDGSQSYDYIDVNVFGREIIDTFFLSINYDIGRKYESYGLKTIIRQEGLEREDRQHYDAGKIRHNYQDPVEWAKICEYAEHDADDALALFDLMIPSVFYYNQSIPRQFQQIINTATGSQVNSFMIRSYLQEGHSIPKPTPPLQYEGGISFGNPGVYKNVYKVDVASLYPSIILQYKIYNREKDPKANFLKMVETFTKERLKNKALANETGERRYRDLEQAQKIMINSAYGFLGAPGLNFNSPRDAGGVTFYGRAILRKAIDWAEGRGFSIVNADTDSISYSTPSKLTEEEFKAHIEELNNTCEDGIRWEDDGTYKRVAVIAAKNYVLYDGKKLTIKGSGLKATMKEVALRNFIHEVAESLVKDRKDEVYDIYKKYSASINNITPDSDIESWCSKKTITKAVLNPERTTEQRIKDAVQKAKLDVSEGDKVYVFFDTEDSLACREDFKGEISKKKLFNKLYKSLEVFNKVIDVELFPNYSLKRNQGRLNDI